MPGVAIEVIDDGPGIPETALPCLFDRFYGIEAARPRGGSGLGLVIVRTLVEPHGGTVSTANRERRGASFAIWVPDASALRVHASG
jgi:signal transduction histidine kinase